MLCFTLSDMGTDFHFGCTGGRVIAGMGAADADVQLRMGAAVLDGMFTGAINGMQAAMSGKLSFTGDTTKAMSLQQMQADLSRLYSAAREQIGDPGDLDAGQLGPGELGSNEPIKTRATVSDAQSALRDELAKCVNELYALQLITATGGNVSARIPGTDEVLITPSALFKGNVTGDMLVRVDLDGQPLDEGPAPSSERLMHTLVLKHRPDAMAVVHAHAAHATILANAELPFLPISTEAAFFGDIPRVPFVMPGTTELAEAVAGAMGDKEWAVLMQNHGLLVAGRSLRRAADMVEIIERSCEIILGCKAVGKDPPVLPDDVVKKLRALGDLVA